MRLSASAAVQNGAFSEFLAAGIGEEKNGMTLSLLSALTRLGIDPWQEAERLAGLPESKAVAALTALLARATGAGDDTPTLAASLLRLLPRPGQAPAAEPAARARDTAGLLAGLSLSLPKPETLRWWVIVGTLALALLANFW